jgi:hypothetical protein
MLLPKETIPGKISFESNSDVYLESAHLCIKKNISERIFGEGTVVLTVYYPQEHSFMVSPSGEDFFRKIHKAKQQMLKSKNLFGDKSISIQELILDEGIDETNRELEFVLEETLKILKVKL